MPNNSVEDITLENLFVSQSKGYHFSSGAKIAAWGDKAHQEGPAS
jgi:hypothetical protein